MSIEMPQQAKRKSEKEILLITTGTRTRTG